MKVLIACEFSGVVRRAFRAKGHDAWSCDLLPSEDESPFHIQADLRNVREDSWDFVGYHVPCTRLCNSGVRWLHERNLWSELDEACELFNLTLDDKRKGYSENPIPHKYALARIRRKYDQIVQPYEFGHGETKATCLWLRQVPKLIATDIVEGRAPKVHHASPGPDRWKERSRTYEGFALAMADQWGML